MSNREVEILKGMMEDFESSVLFDKRRSLTDVSQNLAKFFIQIEPLLPVFELGKSQYEIDQTISAYREEMDKYTGRVVHYSDLSMPVGIFYDRFEQLFYKLKGIVDELS